MRKIISQETHASLSRKLSSPAASERRAICSLELWAAALLSLCILTLFSAPVSAQTMITGAQIRNPLNPVSSLPSACTPYTVYFLTTNNTAYICSSPGTFTQLGASGSSGSSDLPSQTGTPGYLYSNGSSFSWNHVITGGSGALDCTTTPGQCDVTSIVPLKGSANLWTGVNDFNGGLLRLPERTIADLLAHYPAASNTGREFILTDGLSPCDVAAGGGNYSVLVRSNGASYVAPNCSQGGEEGGGSSAFSAITDGTNSAKLHIGAGGSLDATNGGTIAATSVGGVTITGTPSAGSIPIASSSTMAAWGAASAGGAVAGVAYPLFNAGYSSSQAIFVTAAKNALTWAFPTTAPMTLPTGMAFNLTGAASSNCGAGNTPCGFSMAITSLDPNHANPPANITVQCQTETIYTGHPTSTKDTSTTGWKSMAWSSGSNVSGGTCTLPAGGHVLVIASESSTIALRATNGVNSLYMVYGGINPYYFGWAMNFGTGTGSTYAVAGANAVSWSPLAGGATDVPYVVVY
jgi:hypothetical protein